MAEVVVVVAQGDKDQVIAIAQRGLAKIEARSFIMEGAGGLSVATKIGFCNSAFCFVKLVLGRWAEYVHMLGTLGLLFA